MYAPRYLISNTTLRNVGQIEAAKEVIENAPLVPNYEKDFQSDATLRQVYHGTHIEGNDLTLDQTRQVLEGMQVFAHERDIQEVINYRNVMKVVDDLAASRNLYDIPMLLEIHKATVERLVEPERAGVIRNTQVVIREEGTGSVIFMPPPPIEVPYLLQDFFTWLNSPEAYEVYPVIRAAIAHYVLVSIHPFVEGNGRTVRAFTTMMLLREGYDVKRFFAIEEHFDNDLDGYYSAFSVVDQGSQNIAERDMTPWIDYFTKALAVELTKIKEKIRKLSVDTSIRTKIGEQVALSARQMRLIEYMTEYGQTSMKEFKDIITMVSEDTILRDLKDLQKKGIIVKEGSTKAARYGIRRT